MLECQNDKYNVRSDSQIVHQFITRKFIVNRYGDNMGTRYPATSSALSRSIHIVNISLYLTTTNDDI